MGLIFTFFVSLDKNDPKDNTINTSGDKMCWEKMCWDNSCMDSKCNHFTNISLPEKKYVKMKKQKRALYEAVFIPFFG